MPRVHNIKSGVLWCLSYSAVIFEERVYRFFADHRQKIYCFFLRIKIFKVTVKSVNFKI